MYVEVDISTEFTFGLATFCLINCFIVEHDTIILKTTKYYVFQSLDGEIIRTK